MDDDDYVDYGAIALFVITLFWPGYISFRIFSIVSLWTVFSSTSMAQRHMHEKHLI